MQFDPVLGIRTRILGTVPFFIGDFGTEPCDDDGDGTEGERFTPIRVAVTVINLPTDCAQTIAGAFTYFPDDTSCRGDAAPDDGMP